MKKNHRRINGNNIIVFSIMMVIIVAFCCIFAFRGQDNWSSEVYSSTSDAEIGIQDGSSIELQFTISDNDFQGISLRLSPRNSIFENEMLEFMMVDQKTGETIAEYEMYVKNEVYRSAAFARLPYEDSKGKTVSVQIIGDHIQNIPYFYASKNFTKGTTMYVNDVPRDNVLVFSGMYMTRAAVNYQWFAKGGILLLLLVTIFLWPRKVEKKTEDFIKTGVTLYTIHWWQRVWSIVKKHRKVICFCGLSVLYFCLVLFVYEVYVEDIMKSKISKSLVEKDQSAETLVMNSSSRLWELYYTATNDSLSTLSYNVKVQDDAPEAKLHIQIYDGEENICYYDEMISSTKLARTPFGKWEIFLNAEYIDSAKKKILVKMEPLDFESTRLEFQAGFADGKNYMYCDGKKLIVVPELQATYKDNDYIRNLYVLFSVLVYGFLLLIYCFFVGMKLSAEQAFIPVTLVLGIIYMLIIPVYSVPDEYTHIDTAYIISNRILGIGAENSAGYEYKRTIDIETEEESAYNVTLSDYRRLYTSFFDKTEDQSLTSCCVKNALANANVFAYFPAAIGITLGRMLKFGTLPMLLLGRLMNLIAYVLLIFLAIRKLPGGKHIAMLYAATPIALQEAASFSYDGMINGVAILFVSYCLFFAYTRIEKNIYDIIILMSSLFFMASAKGGVYLPICFLILLIPIEQRWKIKRHIGYLLILLTCIMTFFLQNNILGLINRIFLDLKSSINPFTGQVMYTFGYLVKHPYKLISLYVNTVFTEVSRYIYEFFGGKMGSQLDLQMPWIYVLIFIIIFLLAICSKDSNKKIRKTGLFIVSIFLVLGSILLINLSMLVSNTETSYNSITGVQGRYFIPCIFPLLILINYFLKKRYNVSMRKLNFIYYLVHVVFVYNIIMVFLGGI